MDANHEGLLFSWFQVCLGPTTRQAGPTGTMLALQPLIPFLLTSFLFVNQLQQCHAVYASGDNVFSGHMVKHYLFAIVFIFFLDKTNLCVLCEENCWFEYIL